MKAVLRQTPTENRIQIDGHARDELACAGVSMVVQSYFSYLINAKDVEIKSLEYDSGKLHSTVIRTPETDVLHRQMEVALSLVERKYPDEIALTIE